MKFSEALTGYWLERRRGFSPNTIRDYENTFRQFQYSVRDCNIYIITTDHVRQFLNDLHSRGLAPKTILNAWIALSSFWSWAEIELDATHIIRGKIKQPATKRNNIVPYTFEEIRLMLTACDQSNKWATRTRRMAVSRQQHALRDRAIITVLLDTGLRASELCALQVRDYAPQQGRLQVKHGKGNKMRHVYIGDSAKRILWRYLASRQNKPDNSPLFATRTDNYLTRENLLKTIKRIADRAGVVNATLHRFRHTFAISYLRNGGNLLTLQRILGHEKMETVRLYARIAQTDIEQAHRLYSPADRL